MTNNKLFYEILKKLKFAKEKNILINIYCVGIKQKFLGYDLNQPVDISVYKNVQDKTDSFSEKMKILEMNVDKNVSDFKKEIKENMCFLRAAIKIHGRVAVDIAWPMRRKRRGIQ